MRNRYLVAMGVAVIVLVGGTAAFVLTHPSYTPSTGSPSTTVVDKEAPPETNQPANITFAPSNFGTSVAYQPVNDARNGAVAANFDTTNISGLTEMQQAYGVTFSPDDLSALSNHKFVIKKVTDTNLYTNAGDNDREFYDLYRLLTGSSDYKTRGLQNAEFFSSDVFFNAFNNIYTETLKEMENTIFYPAVKTMSATLFDHASQQLAAATTDADKVKWTKVRNYFAVADALFATAAQPLSAKDYFDAEGHQIDPTQVQADFTAKDHLVDTYDNAAAFVKQMHLDADSETIVLADLKYVFDANNHYQPNVFLPEYQAYAQKMQMSFDVDFSQFTPRSTYTSSSLRRAYFRGMKWFIMVPFFLGSKDLTNYAYGVSELLAEDPQSAADYQKLDDAINFLVGNSDDLAPADFQAALAAGGGDQNAPAAQAYLQAAHNPKIKDLAATYPDVGTVQTQNVLDATKGLRFFSGKFILDSYWTGFLTQGDEAVRPGYPAKLPPMASSLEVMDLLGSTYAKNHLSDWSFYSGSYAPAIDKGLSDLSGQVSQMTDADWKTNVYTTWLWTIQSLFQETQDNQKTLPKFMQSDAWAAKTLMTASAWWTELRHATILYAKQSFAEKGGGGPPDCDTRDVPPPPKGYIEPDAETFNRLSYLAKRMDQGLKDQQYALQNMGPLENFINLMDTVQSFVKKELADAKLNETVETSTDGTCTHHDIVGTSDWETLRLQIVGGLNGSLPVPTEGPVLTAKDHRAALVADVHTGGDSANPASILYEGEGVPYIIFTAVSDVNGPRLTVGLTYSHYEFEKPYGGKRMTDEEWQQNFYQGSDETRPYQYTDPSTWPAENTWYAPMFGTSQ